MSYRLFIYCVAFCSSTILICKIGDLIVGYIKCCWALCFVDEIKRKGRNSSREETQ